MHGTRWNEGWRAAVMAAGLAWARSSDAQEVAPAVSPLFSAEVVVEESIVDARGTVVEVRPATRYRLVRRATESGIETEMTFAAGRLFDKGPLVDPRGGMRIVRGPGPAGTRVYDASGALVATLDDSATAVSGGRDAGMVFADRDVPVRAAAMSRQHGQARGRVGRRLRYVLAERDAETETLVEPDTMLPAEVNVVKDGALALRTTFGYARMPGGRWYLATARSETALTDGSGRRFVSTRTQVNVTGTEAR
jgi:hypothetical protein